MNPLMRSCVLLALLASADGSLSVPNPSQRGAARPANLQTAAGHGRINPELEPVSDHKFFKADYPDDRRPHRYHDFGYPYPTVQDSEDYDKDYVEDKNDDGGYWKAQMRYDELKNKLTKEKDDLKRALAKEQEEERELQEALDALAAAERAAKDAEAARKLAAPGVNELKGLKKEIDINADEVEGEVTDLEACKKQLMEARKKLKVLLEEKAVREKEKKERLAAEKAAEEAEIVAQQKEEEAEKKVKEEDKEHEVALKSYKEELEDVKRAEAALEEAAVTLRKFRHPDPDGGVYEVKSGAAALTAKSLLATLLLSMLY
jgi:hypothetical protein